MIKAHGVSDVGKKRLRNEDSFVVNQDIDFYMVADGMGGHNAGDVASATAAKTIESFLLISYQERELTWPFGIDPQISFDANRLRTAVKLANHKIWQLADSHQEYVGMGTTVVSMVVTNNIATMASVGDSRGYLIRAGTIQALTRDDIWLNETWVQKAFTEDQLSKIPLRNVLSKAVGSKEDIDFAVQELTLEEGDLILLCTDGFHGLVSEEQMLSISLEKFDNLPDICNSMIQAANEAGGRDNITVVILKYSK